MEQQSDTERLRLDALLEGLVRRRDIDLALVQAQRIAVEGQDAFATQVLSLLVDCVRLPFYPGNRREPFGDLFSLQARDRFKTGKFNAGDQQQVAALVEVIKSPFLKARLGDLLWELHKDHRAARIAVAAHLDQAVASRDVSWNDEIAHLTRAASLSKMLDKKGDLHRQVLQQVKAVTADIDPTQPDCRALKLWGLLAQYEGDEPLHLARAAVAYAQEQEKLISFNIARRYWLFASELARSAGDSTLGDSAIVAAGETHVLEAEAYAKNTALGTSFHNAAHSMKKAIEVLRTAPNTHERVRELKVQLAGY